MVKDALLFYFFIFNECSKSSKQRNPYKTMQNGSKGIAIIWEILNFDLIKKWNFNASLTVNLSGSKIVK